MREDGMLKVWLVHTREDERARGLEALSGLGCRVRCCRGPEEVPTGMEGEEPPDLALLEAGLPPAGGAGLCGRLAALRPAPVVVAVHAPGRAEQAADCLAAGATACLTWRADGAHWKLAVDLAGGERRLAALRQERSNVLSMLVHDMKTPLISIRGFADLIRRKADDLAPEKASRYAEIIVNESSKLEGMIGDFLEASRRRVGSIKLKLRPTDLKSELLELATVFRPRCQAAGLELALTGLEELPGLTADPGRLRRALANLLENALMYSRPGGRVEVAVSVWEGGVLVSVSDQGQGIAPAERERIFEPFYRGAGQPKGHGHGLGLSGVRAIAEAHGGRVEVDSEPGRGSTFTLLLPRRPL